MATSKRKPSEPAPHQPDLLDQFEPDNAYEAAHALEQAGPDEVRPGEGGVGGDLDAFAVLAGAKGVLKKANEAIVMTPVNGDLVFLSRKAFNVLLYHAQQQGLKANNRFGIPFSVLKKDSGFNSRDVAFLKERFRNLIRTTIEWGWIGESLDGAPQRIWTGTALLADAYFEVNPQTKELWLYWSYSETLKQQLLESRQYTKLSLAIMARLRSLPALSLYELAARYETSPSRVSKKATWEQWVSVLRGKPIADYPTLDYRRFKRETLIPARAQVNAEQNDFEVDWKEFKAGKRVTHLQLVITPRRKGTGVSGPDAELRSTMDLGLFNRMLAIGLHQYTADSIYGSCDERVLRRALDQVEARLANKKMPKVNSIEAYLKDRVRWQLEHIDQEATEQAPAAAAAQMEEAETSEPKAPAVMDERLALVRDKYTAYHLAKAKEMYEEATPDMRAEWLARFESEKLPTALKELRESYEKNGLKSSMVKGVFNMWLYQTTWNPNPSSTELVEFGLEHNLIKVG